MGPPRNLRIDDAQVHAVRVHEHVRGGGARNEVRHHLPRDRLRTSGDAFMGDAVVRGEQGEATAMKTGRERALYAGDLLGQVSIDPSAPSGLVFESMVRRIASSSARETGGKSNTRDLVGLDGTATAIEVTVHASRSAPASPNLPT